jgi:ATP-dependent Clp protease protease subunit
MKRKFWNWVRNEGERTLFLNGEISDETWYGDEVTPKLFKDELLSGEGDITVWINSPGGDVFAAAQIYNMLMDYTILRRILVRPIGEQALPIFSCEIKK